MSVTTFEGVVENGRVRLPEGVVLTEKQTVFVIDPEPVSATTKKVTRRPPDQSGRWPKVRDEVLFGRTSLTRYDNQNYQPPTPVASLILQTLDGRNQTVSDVPAIVDSAADVTVLRRWPMEQSGLIPQTDESINLAWFDGGTKSAEFVELQALFQGGRFQGSLHRDGSTARNRGAKPAQPIPTALRRPREFLATSRN